MGSAEPKQAYADARKAAMSHPPRQEGLPDPCRGRTVTAEARAMGMVLGSVRGDVFDTAAAGLDDDQLRAVLNAASTEESPKGWNTRALVAIVEAAATGHDTRQKLRIFRGAIAVRGQIRNPNDGKALGDGKEASRIIHALTALLQSDPKGLVDRLNTEEPGGQSLSVYVRQMLEEGRTKALGEIISSLARGRGVSHNSLTFANLREKDAAGQSYYGNAANLAYFVGAIVGSIKDMDPQTKIAAGRIDDIHTVAALILRLLRTTGGPHQ